MNIRICTLGSSHVDVQTIITECLGVQVVLPGWSQTFPPSPAGLGFASKVLERDRGIGSLAQSWLYETYSSNS